MRKAKNLTSYLCSVVSNRKKRTSYSLLLGYFPQNSDFTPTLPQTHFYTILRGKYEGRELKIFVGIPTKDIHNILKNFQNRSTWGGEKCYWNFRKGGLSKKGRGCGSEIFHAEVSLWYSPSTLISTRTLSETISPLLDAYSLYVFFR